MSAPPRPAAPADFRALKARGEKSAWLTAYDATFARLLARSGVDGLLVGDSVGQVVAGFETTLPVTLEQMIYHARAVRRGAPDVFVIVDLPFLSYQASPRDAVRSAGRVLKETEAGGVKVEGGRDVVAAVRRMVRAGIPVMGHVGLLPQSVRALGGYPLRAVEDGAARELVEDARRLQDAGCFAVVLEKVPAEVGRTASEALEIPTIGIGAGSGCDGQVLVLYDLLGMDERFRPRFVRRYADVGGECERAVREFVHDVKAGRFPSADESYGGS
ncbi:MAG: 3-methyl-2-oxobutanoate hydroxymethyltransferase [Gemmatimonadota bacterium]